MGERIRELEPKPKGRIVDQWSISDGERMRHGKMLIADLISDNFRNDVDIISTDVTDTDFVVSLRTKIPYDEFRGIIKHKFKTIRLEDYGFNRIWFDIFDETKGQRFRYALNRSY